MSDRNNNQESIADQFFESSTSVPPMGVREKSKAERDKDKQKEGWFFNAIWMFLALTTFLFGFQNLAPLLSTFFQWMPFPAEKILQISGWTGGIMAVLFMDGGYKLWGFIALNRSETSDQVSIARFAESVAFWSSAYFTGAVLVSGFPDFVSAIIIRLLGTVGVVVFVGSVLSSMVSMFFFYQKSVDAQQQLHDAEMKSQQTTEWLDIYKQTEQEATRQAAEIVKSKVGAMSKRLGSKLAKDVERNMESQIGNDEKK